MKGGPLAARRLLGNRLPHWTQGLEIPPRAGSLTPPRPRCMQDREKLWAGPSHMEPYYAPGRHLPPRALAEHAAPHTRNWKELGSGARETWVEP